jgi:hypothetical protein
MKQKPDEKETKMNLHSTGRANWLFSGLALGALTMFLLDPDKGRRRRALARDKIYSAGVKTRKRIDAKSRDLANRSKGLRAGARHMMSSDDKRGENRSSESQPET